MMPTLLMSDVVTLLTDAGIPSFADMSGGGCATMYVGPPFPDPDGQAWERYPLLVGPGTWNYGQPIMHTDELYVGPDDDGETDPLTIAPESDARQVADIIIRYLSTL